MTPGRCLDGQVRISRETLQTSRISRCLVSITDLTVGNYQHNIIYQQKRGKNQRKFLVLRQDFLMISDGSSKTGAGFITLPTRYKRQVRKRKTYLKEDAQILNRSRVGRLRFGSSDIAYVKLFPH
jgi:hypothetical protein